MKTTTVFQPDYSLHPGETLAETLEELGMLQTELAQRMGRPLQMISEIVQGKKAITAEPLSSSNAPLASLLTFGIPRSAITRLPSPGSPRNVTWPPTRPGLTASP